MKVLKGIGLFFVYPVFMFFLGICFCLKMMDYFYPQKYENMNKQKQEVSFYEEPKLENETVNRAEDMHFLDAASIAKVLSSDTEYVLKETDLLKNTVVETVWKLPAKYVGMNREEFEESLKRYEMCPPLSELERGFVGLEVLSFSRDRVVVQMNYKYMQPGDMFYLSVKDNEVVVLLEDRETVYMNTGILLNDLPDSIQFQIMELLPMESETDLYDFLESYSS